MLTVAHLTTVDASLRYLLLPQLTAVVDLGARSMGISAPGEDVEFLESKGIEHVALASSTRAVSIRGDLKAALELRRILREHEIDVLHTHNPKPGIYGRIIGRLSGVPIVVNTVHGFYATSADSRAKRAFVYALEWFASLFSDAELVQSAEDVETMRKWRIGRWSDVRHLGNGVDIQRFRPGDDETRRAILDSLGVDDSRPVVGCVARLVAEKGIRDLIAAYERRQSDYHLMIVGPWDPNKADAITADEVAEAEKLGVQFLGQRGNVEELYNAWDVFVLPSYREGFPRSAMEAAASGLPVVATDIRGCREVVDDGANGILVPTASPDALATAIDKLVLNPGMRRSMGEAGVTKASQEFDEDDVVARVLDCYVDIAASKGLSSVVAGLTPRETGGDER